MRTPSKQIKFLLFTDLPMANGTKLNVIAGYSPIYDVANLPPTDSLIAFVKRMAELNIAQSKAARCDDQEYMGPVLYENYAANVFLHENTYIKTLSTYIHSHFHPNKREYDNSYQKIGKKVVSNQISLSGSKKIFNSWFELGYKQVQHVCWVICLFKYLLSQRSNSRLSPAFVSKLVLEQSTFIHLHVAYHCFCCCERDYMTYKVSTTSVQFSLQKVNQLLFYPIHCSFLSHYLLNNLSFVVKTFLYPGFY